MARAAGGGVPPLSALRAFGSRQDEELEEAGLAFTLGREVLGEYREVELVPGGRDIPVTGTNVLRYVTLVANYKLNVETLPQCHAFTEGMLGVLPRHLLGMFAPVRASALARAGSGMRGPHP